MLKFGDAPYLECSSKGDKRFSAFYARPSILGGQSIEEAYQAQKVFGDGTTGQNWRVAKGKRAINQEECAASYEHYWRAYVKEFNLLPVLQAASGLSDIYGQLGHVCQAEVLWRIRCE